MTPDAAEAGEQRAEPSTQGEYVVEFLCRQQPSHALPAAASVLYATRGVLSETVQLAEEILLIKDVAGEIYRLGQELPGGEAIHPGEHDQLQRGTKSLSAADVAQWEQRCQEEEEEAAAAAAALEMGEDEYSRTLARSNSGEPNDSHRRRRMLTAHHKGFIGEDRANEDIEDRSLIQLTVDVSSTVGKGRGHPHGDGSS